MNHNSIFAKILHWTGIVLMGLTAGFTLMGGIGTVCAALFTEKFAAGSESMAKLLGWSWLYTIFMLVTIAIGVMMIRATVLLIKGASTAYRDALISLVAGVVVGGIHIFASRAIRGSSMPVDMVVYTAVFTLIVFLLFRLPPIWQGVNFEKLSAEKSNENLPAAITLFANSALAFSIQFIAGGTHTWGGVNYADAFHVSMNLIGVGLVLAAILLIACEFLPARRETVVPVSGD